MATILTKLATQLHNEFQHHLDYLFFRKYGLIIATNYCSAKKKWVSEKENGDPFSHEQQQYLEAITETYSMILALVQRKSKPGR